MDLADLLGLSTAWTPLAQGGGLLPQPSPSAGPVSQPTSAAPDQTSGALIPQPRPAGTGYQFNLPTTQQQMGTQQQSAQPMYHGLKGFLGMLGDALLVAHGVAPMYRQQQQQMQANSALQGFLTNPDQAVAALMRIPGQEANAIDLYKAVHPSTENPEVVKDLIAAGIDPKSAQGKQIILDNIGGKNTDTSYVKDLQAAGIDPKSPEGIRLLYAHNSPAGYLLTPPGSAGAPAQSLPVVNTTDDYNKLPAGTRYRNSAGQVGVKGGATAPQGGQASPAPGGFR